MNTCSKWTLAACLAAVLAVCACSPRQHEAPVQSSLQNGGGSSQGSMAYPTPAPAGNLVTTPNR